MPTTEYLPTPAEIELATAEIRSEWTPEEFHRRATTITDLEPVRRRDLIRCKSCGGSIQAGPCLYCNSKSARTHSPSEFVDVQPVDEAGISDASRNALDLIHEAYGRC